jgi:glycosyltransferase 2 family protein
MPPNTKAGFLRRNRIKLILSLVATVWMIYGLRKTNMLIPKASAFAHVQWWGVPAYLGVQLLVHYFRATRWRFLLRSFTELPLRRLLAVSWIGFAAILVLPFRLGEFVRPYMIREKGKISMSASTGTILAERVLDGLVVSAILAASLLWVPTMKDLPAVVVGLPAPSLSLTAVRATGFVVLYVFIAAFTTIAVLYFARSWARKFTFFVLAWVSPSLAEKIASTAEKLASGLGFLERPKDGIPFILETLLYWGLNACGMWLLAYTCGIVHADGTAITFGETLGIMGMLGATILIPSPLPGLFGVFQAGIFCGMSFYFPADVIQNQGSAFVFLLYGIQLVWTLCAAGWFLRDPIAREQLRKAQDGDGDQRDSLAPQAVQ